MSCPTLIQTAQVPLQRIHRRNNSQGENIAKCIYVCFRSMNSVLKYTSFSHILIPIPPLSVRRNLLFHHELRLRKCLHRCGWRAPRPFEAPQVPVCIEADSSHVEQGGEPQLVPSRSGSAATYCPAITRRFKRFLPFTSSTTTLGFGFLFLAQCARRVRITKRFLVQ